MDFSGKSQEYTGMLIVISGPSGVGKGTLINGLLEILPGMEKCVTYTTRKPRPGEVAGVHYHFTDTHEFRRMIEAGEFLEYAHVHLNFYGTPLLSVMKAREAGRDVILEIDVQGGLTVKQKVPDAVMIFVAPPSLEELERRLRSRYTDSEEAIVKRCENARREIEQISMYDYLVVNDNIDEAVDRLRCIIMAERSRIVRC